MPDTIASPNQAKTYEDYAIAALKDAGYRITMPRVQVIRALADTTKALSAYAIHEKILAGNGKIDVVSCYRILSTLQEIGVVAHIGVVDGFYPVKEGFNGNRTFFHVDESDGAIHGLPISVALIECIEDELNAAGLTMRTVKIEVAGGME